MPIKQRVRFNLEAKEKSRQIESIDKRTVHFLFNSGVKPKTSPFARKFEYFLEGKHIEKEEQEKEAYEEYIQKFENEDLDEGDVNPVVFGEMNYFTCELSGGLT